MRPAHAFSVLLSLLLSLGVMRVHAQGVPDWEPTGLGVPVRVLVALESGPLFATAADGATSRSDDGGDTWQPVPPPPGAQAQVLAVSPANAAVLFGRGQGGTYRSLDGGATWDLVAPGADPTVAVAVSPADPNLVYSATLGGVIRFFRSIDQGTTWQPLDVIDAAASPCALAVNMLQAHVSDPQRVFRAAECYAGRTLGSNLVESRDQGMTWSDVFVGRGRGFHPARLVGGAGVQPSRLYLAASSINPTAPGALFRSDDDGATWQQILATTDASLGGLAYDPSQPDRIYVGAGAITGGFSLGRGVKTSPDGGLSWQDLGRQDLGTIGDLALAANTLYAATETGVWRFRIPAGGVIMRPPKT